MLKEDTFTYSHDEAVFKQIQGNYELMSKSLDSRNTSLDSQMQTFQLDWYL